MRAILVLVVLLALAAGASHAGSGNFKLTDIAASIAASNGDQQRIPFAKYKSATLYGYCNGTNIRVGLYQSVDGATWKPLLSNVSVADSAYTYTFSSGARLNVVLPIMTEVQRTASWERELGPLNVPYLKVVVTNLDGITALTSNAWFIQFTNE